MEGGVLMIISNNRKQYLSGWLKNNYYSAYETPIKLQKFLFFYESFSKVRDQIVDFSYLKGYKKGPVFSQVWGDYTKERDEFDQCIDMAYLNNPSKQEINEEIAEKCAFLVQTLSQKELSELSHKMHIWKSKEPRIMNGELQVPLLEEDFTKDDENLIQMLDLMYPISMIKESSILAINDHYFVLKKTDIPKLTEMHYDVLDTLTDTEELINPVYVEIDEEGRLVID
jgi:uncharacterized phage-associated protein